MVKKAVLAAVVFAGLIAINAGVGWLRDDLDPVGCVVGAVAGTVLVAVITRLEG